MLSLVVGKLVVFDHELWRVTYVDDAREFVTATALHRGIANACITFRMLQDNSAAGRIK